MSGNHPLSISKKTAAEFLGTAILLCVAIGSGVSGERVFAGNPAMILLAKSLASSAVLVALLFAFETISGAHLNPIVTAVQFLQGDMDRQTAIAYVMAQCLGGLAGAAIAHLMFGLPVLSIAHTARAGAQQLLGEFVASFGLIAIIFGCRHVYKQVAPFAVGLYLLAAFWFTSSSSFANPALTLACSMSNTFSGIQIRDVPGFIAAQVLGGILAAQTMLWFEDKRE